MKGFCFFFFYLYFRSVLTSILGKKKLSSSFQRQNRQRNSFIIRFFHTRKSLFLQHPGALQRLTDSVPDFPKAPSRVDIPSFHVLAQPPVAVLPLGVPQSRSFSFFLVTWRMLRRISQLRIPNLRLGVRQLRVLLIVSPADGDGYYK